MPDWNDGHLVGIEVLDASHFLPDDLLADAESGPGPRRRRTFHPVPVGNRWSRTGLTAESALGVAHQVTGGGIPRTHNLGERTQEEPYIMRVAAGHRLVPRVVPERRLGAVLSNSCVVHPPPKMKESALVVSRLR
jgi:hypothetical protein